MDAAEQDVCGWRASLVSDTSAAHEHKCVSLAVFAKTGFEHDGLAECSVLLEGRCQKEPLARLVCFLYDDLYVRCLQRGCGQFRHDHTVFIGNSTYFVGVCLGSGFRSVILDQVQVDSLDCSKLQFLCFSTLACAPE